MISEKKIGAALNLFFYAIVLYFSFNRNNIGIDRTHSYNAIVDN